MLGLAYVAFFLNLFNLTPIFPLDGGWIVGAISPRLWLVGIVLMFALYAFGIVHNPLILILLLLSLPRMLKGLCSYVLVGQYERRIFFSEKDAIVRRKHRDRT